MATAPLDLKLSVKGLPELDRLVKRMNVLETEVKQLNGQLPKAANNIRRVGTASRQASSGVNKLGNALKGIAIGFAAIQSLKFTIFKTAELETQTKSLKVLTGSLKTAKDIIKELQDFGAVTPFTSTELIDTAKRLKAFGVDTEKLVVTTKRLGDVAGATGADLGGIATAFGQIQAKGRLQGEELLQLQERGIGLQDELQKMYGLTGEEFRKALEKGRFSAEAVDLALKNLTSTGGKYADGAIAQSDTLAGKFSTLIDGITRIAQALGNILAPALKSVLDLAIDAVNAINAAFAARSISPRQKQGFKAEAEAEVRRFAGPLPGGPFGAGEIVVRTNGKTYKGSASAVTSQITNDLINKEVQRLVGEAAPKTPKSNVQIALPPLLGAAPDGNSGGSSGANAALKAQTEAEQLAQRQSEAYASINQQLDRSIALNSGVNDYIKQGLQNQFEYEDVVARINTEVAAGRQAELIALAELKKEQADFNVLKGAATNFGSDVGKEFADQLPKVNKELTETDKLLKGAFDIVANGLTSAIQGLIQGTKDFNDVLSDVLSQLSSLFLNAAFSSLGKGLKVPGFADGGRPEPNKLSIVGEEGPELFVPDTAGTIIPNDAFDAARGSMGGSSNSSEAFAENSNSISATNSFMRERSVERESQTTVGGSGSMVIETQVINNVEYATLEQVRVASAASAKQARAQVFSDMKNKPSRRAAVGLR